MSSSSRTTALLPAFVFAIGLAVVGWIAIGYIGSNTLALAVSLLIGACYLVGGLELLRYRQATKTLADGVARNVTALRAGLQALPTMGVVLGYPGFWAKDPATGIDCTSCTLRLCLGMFSKRVPAGTGTPKLASLKALDVLASMYAYDSHRLNPAAISPCIVAPNARASGARSGGISSTLRV